MKPNKAAGPDEIIIELLKALSAENLEPFLRVLQTWWNTENITKGMLQAIVVSLYKKGDPKKMENYRPIKRHVQDFRRNSEKPHRSRCRGGATKHPIRIQKIQIHLPCYLHN